MKASVNTEDQTHRKNRSMLKDDEINVVILDEQVTGELIDHFLEDLKHCEKLEKEKPVEKSLGKDYSFV